MIKLLNFTTLTNEEHQLVLAWRNSQNVSRYMHTKSITLKEHFAFVDSLKHNHQKSYFLVEDDGNYIGVIYLVDTFLGLYANPKRKKVGDLLLQQIITFAFDVKKLFSLKAEVFKENLSAVKLYERFGFKIMQENEQLQIMELKKLTTIEGSE